MENSFQRKKKSCKFCSKMPLVPFGQEFRPKCNFVIFALKPVDSVFSCPKRKWKILLNEKKIQVNFVRKRP